MDHNRNKIFVFFLICSFIFISGQKIIFGKYQSEKGSYLILNKDKTFYYQKEKNYISDVGIKEIEIISSGFYFQKNNTLFFTSPKFGNSYLDSLKAKSFIINDNNKELILKKDSIEINVNNKNKLFKVFICNTGLNYLNDPNDSSGCIELGNENRLPMFFSKEYFFRIYPNIDEFTVRNDCNINTLFFDSFFYKKDDTSDISLIINFDYENFSYMFFNEDIAIIEDGEIIFKGERFIKQN